MKQTNKSIALMASLLILLAGCYPQGPEYAEELDVVITNSETGYDFTQKQTYALPEKIVKITGNLVEGDEPQFIPDAVAVLILDQIEKNMDALGWQKVGVDEEPDLLLTPASWETTTIIYYYDYWYWWYGGYYPGWGYYPYYPVSVTSYSTGTLLMRLIDPEIESANGVPVAQWNGSINGILTYTYDATRFNKAIDQAFAQSPYLKTN